MTHLLKCTLKSAPEPPGLWKKNLSESFHLPLVHRSGALLERKGKNKASDHLFWYFWCTEPASKWSLCLFALLSSSSAVCKSPVQLKNNKQGRHRLLERS